MNSSWKLLFLTLVIAYAIPLQAQLPPVQQQAIVLKRQLQLNHYSPRPVNDSLSADIFTAFIDYLDDKQDIFTSEEIKLLSAYKYALDDELNNGSWKFLDLVTEVFKKGLERADSLIKDVLQKPFDFSAEEKIVVYRKQDPVYAKDAKEQKAKWTKWFKYVMLGNAYSIAAADSTQPALKEVLAKNEMILRDKFRKSQAKIFASFLEPGSFERNMKETYFNAITLSFDPHSSFFSPRQQEDFQSELSTEEYSFGFEIDESKDEKIIISQLIPGGPAWKTGEIHKDDELLQLQWQGKPPVDVSAISIDEVEEMLAGSNHDELQLKIKKTNGIIKTIVLRKEKIETEQEIVKGYLLAGEKKIGYISLPGFYTTWDDENGSGCANDLAKEVIKLKKENPEGLILDLRYNGGGSLYEALQLCGIFIDEGPLVGIKENNGKFSFGKDPNRGTIYDGPLVIMVNNQSASASELVAAALQDYNRAVIVGSATYGKATKQQMFPLDSNAAKMKNPKTPEGFVKITTGKLYRLTGEAAQCNGVIPDVILPDAFDGLEYREIFMLHALPADTARKNNYYKPLPALPLAALSQASKERISKDPSFLDLVKSIEKQKTERAAIKKEIPLTPAQFEKWAKEKEATGKTTDEQEEIKNKLFNTVNYRMEKERLQNNIYAAALNEAALQNIQQDFYIQEAYQIIKDLVKLKTSK